VVEKYPALPLSSSRSCAQPAGMGAAGAGRCL